VTDFFRHDRGLRSRFGFIHIQIAQYHHKLITAETRHRIQLTHTIF
jgi:hypothetical protein